MTKTTLVQFNANYTAKRLPPQGYCYPTKVANIGVRHTLANKQTSLLLTLSDVFGSLQTEAERARVVGDGLIVVADHERNSGEGLAHEGRALRTFATEVMSSG